jgi:hypothetical protein
MPQESQQNVVWYVEAGKGIVVLHHALTDYQRWPFWYRDVVGGISLIRDTGMPKVFEGLHERGPADEALPDNPSSSPDKMIAPGVWDFQEYTIKPVENHPVLAGVQSFTVRDEKYKNTLRSDKITPVLETDDPASDRVIGWIGPHPKARVFAIILGHSADAHAHPMYRRIVHNAILWADGRLGSLRAGMRSTPGGPFRKVPHCWELLRTKATRRLDRTYLSRINDSQSEVRKITNGASLLS